MTLLTTAAACAIALVLAAAAPATAAAEPTVESDTSAAPTAAPAYNVIAENNSDRRDGAPSYYVVISAVDLSDAPTFKQNVKQVLQDLNTASGGPVFSARIFDDEATAKGYLSDMTEPPIDQDVATAHAAHAAQQEQHLIATYAGALPGYPYSIAWFPAASPDTPNVGQYADNEPWKPAASA